MLDTSVTQNEKPGLSFQVSFLPPLMVYLSAGLQMLTGIAETFFIKERLGFSAEYLAALGFWAALPYSCKMPIGHLVDLMWRFKNWLIYLGAACMAAGMLIMLGLLVNPQRMQATMSLSAWFVTASLLGPIAFVLQDVVADAMTVEAVKKQDAKGRAYTEQEMKGFHTSLQLLGRIAVIGGTLLVGAINVVFFSGTEGYSVEQKLALYETLFQAALLIPVISIAGVWLAKVFKSRQEGMIQTQEKTSPNGWILGGSLAYVLFAIAAGLSGWTYRQEIVFVVSLTIVLFLMRQMMQDLSSEAREMLIATALIIFFVRLVPSGGAGVTWWQIDVLGFDAAFMSKLSLMGSILTLVGMWLFRAQMMRWSMAKLTVVLVLIGSVLSLPDIGMSYGLHHWSAANTGGVVDARAIAFTDSAIGSLFGQVIFVPMLAWIAASAPANLKATYFAVMASFTNLALSAAQLLTKYLTQIFVLSREVKDKNGAVSTAANYTELSPLLITVLICGVVLPIGAVLFVKLKGWRSA